MESLQSCLDVPGVDEQLGPVCARKLITLNLNPYCSLRLPTRHPWCFLNLHMWKSPETVVPLAVQGFSGSRMLRLEGFGCWHGSLSLDHNHVSHAVSTPEPKLGNPEELNARSTQGSCNGRLGWFGHHDHGGLGVSGDIAILLYFFPGDQCKSTYYGL